MMPALLMLIALAVTVRIFCIAAATRREQWRGHLVRFYLLVMAKGMIVAGAWSIAMGAPFDGVPLLLGVALQCLADRRSAFSSKTP